MKDKTKEQLEGNNQQLRASEQKLKAANQQLKAANQQLMKYEKDMREAQRIGRFGFWDLNIETGELYWSDEVFRMYGYKPQEFIPTYEKFQSILFSEDHDFVQKNVDDALSSKKKYSVDFRFIRPNGEIGWTHCEGDVIKDKKGNAIRFFGTQIDITDRKQTEKLHKFQSNLAVSLADKTTLKQTLGTILKNVFLLEQFDSGGIYLIDEKSGAVDLVEHQGLPQWFVDMVKHFDSDDIRVKMIKKGKPIYQTASELPAAITKEIKHEGILSLAIIPIHHGKKVIGAINLASHIYEVATPDCMRIVESIAESNVGMSISRALAEDALKDNKALLGSVLDSSLSGIMAFKSIRNTQGAIEDFEWLVLNSAAERMVDRRQADLIGKKLLEEMPGNSAEGLFDLYVEVVETGIPLNHEHYYEHEKLKTWFQTVAVKLLDGFVVTFTDISERKQSEEKLIESEEKFRRITETSTNTIYQLDLQGNILFMNPAGARMYGYEPEEMNGMNYKALVTKKSMAEGQEFVKKVMSGDSVEGEMYVSHKDGHEFPIFFSMVPEEKKGKVFGFSGISSDITERKQAEDQLKSTIQQLVASEQQLKAAIQQLSASEQQLKATNQQLMASEQQLRAANQQLMASEQQLRAANQQLMASEQQLKNTNRKLREKEKELRLKNLVFEFSITANSIADNNGIITHTNPGFLKIWGYDSIKEIVGKPIPNFLKNGEEALAIVTALNETGKWEGEYVGLKKDGSTFNAYGLASIIQNERGENIGYQSAVLDITERKQAEEKYRDLVENAGIAIVKDDMDANITYYNNRFLELFGYSEQQIQQKNIRDLIHPEDAGWVIDMHNKRLEKQPVPQHYDFRGVSEDGSTIYLETDVLLIEQDGIPLGTRTYIWDITKRKHTEEELNNHRNHLESLVKERTSELEEKNSELVRFHDATVDREFRMKELRDRIEELEKKMAEKNE